MPLPTPPIRRRIVRRATAGHRPAPQTAAGDQVVEFRNRGNSTLLDTILSTSSMPIRPPRAGKYLHVSDLISNCVRRIALMERYDLPVPSQSLTYSDVFTFAQGDAIHDATKALFAGSVPEQVWGLWSCKCGYLHHAEPCTLAETDMTETCPHCKSLCNVYGESPVFDEEHMIVGNPDLVLYQPNYDAQYIAEIKSISDKKFEELYRPEPDHLLQLTFYWCLKYRAGVRLMDKASVFYVTKGWKFGKGKPYKEFVIEPLNEMHRLNDMLADAKARIAAAADTRAPLPPRIRCSTEDSPNAKNCPACTVCFQSRR